MALINTLSIDISQPSENKEVISSGKASESTGEGSQFSSYMAYEQGKNQAEKRQGSGNEQQPNKDKTIDANKSPDASSAVDKLDKAAVTAEQTEKNTNQSTSDEEQPIESIELDTGADNFGNKRAEVAIKLLDFINASESTSTAKVNAKPQEFATPSAVINGESKQLVQEDVPRSDEAEVQEANDTELQATKPQLKSQISLETIVDVSKSAQTVKSAAAEVAVNTQSEEQPLDNVAAASTVEGEVQIDELLTSGGGKTSESAKNALAASANQSTQINNENTNTREAVQLEQNVAEDIASISSVDSESVLTENKKQQDSISPVKPHIEPVITAKPNPSEQSLQNETLEEQAPDAVNQVVSPASVVNDNTAKVTSDKAAEVRVVNQSTNSVVSTEQQGNQQASSEQENTEQSMKQQQDVSIKEQVQVSAKTSFAEQIVERNTQNAQPVTGSANAELDAKLQTAHERELASIQAAAQRPNHESLSTQSAKSVQAIMQETIAINRKDFSVAVKEKVMVAINQKLRQLEIRLDPPELGSMQVKLNLQNEQAAVNFVVQSQQAKEALEQHMGKLKDMLAQSGVDVGDANIEQRDSQNSEQASAQGQSRYNGSETDDEMSQTLEQVNPNLYKASSTGIDYYA